MVFFDAVVVVARANPVISVGWIFVASLERAIAGRAGSAGDPHEARRETRRRRWFGGQDLSIGREDRRSQYQSGDGDCQGTFRHGNHLSLRLRSTPAIRHAQSLRRFRA